MEKPLILVTNDDGVTAPGIQNLVRMSLQLGDVVVVAPDSPQSGMGHAISIHDPIRIRETSAFKELEIEAYECSGTPVDCVKLAKNVILKGRKPDICVSGINHGSNASINIIYSGTLSAAMEASLEGIPSIGFSLLDFSFEANFKQYTPFVTQLMSYVLTQGLAAGSLLNVNIPKIPATQINGIKVCRQAEARWIEEFQENIDPRGQKYYWMTGRFENLDHDQDTDLWALSNNYISVVPSMHDLTNYKAITEMKMMEAEVKG